MKVLNFGSLNLDYVYQVEHFVQPGETLRALHQTVHCGGKGLNQSIALSKAGVNVYHARCVGTGGEALLQELERNKVDISLVSRVQQIQGNAVIQVDKKGENSILLFGGSNQEVTPEYVKEVLNCFGEGDYIVLQNEISCLKEIIREASKRKMQIVLNPSPFEENLRELDYGAISWLFVNEVEAAQISGEGKVDAAWAVMHEKNPALHLVITLGKEGSVCYTPEKTYFQPAFQVKVVDSTAAGDAYTGYFLASLLEGRAIPVCMERATKASALSIQRQGAADSIPVVEEVDWSAHQGAKEV